MAHRKDWRSNYSSVANQAVHLAQHLVDLEVLHNGRQRVEAVQAVHHVVDWRHQIEVACEMVDHHVQDSLLIAENSSLDTLGSGFPDRPYPKDQQEHLGWGFAS